MRIPAFLAAISILAPLSVSASNTPPHAMHAVSAITLDEPGGTLSNQTLLSLRTHPENSTRAEFLLSQDFTIKALSGEHILSYEISPFEMVPAWNLIQIELEPAASETPYTTVHVNYDGMVQPATSSNYITPDYIELNIDSMWHPLPLPLGAPVISQLTIELNSDWAVAGSGIINYSDNQYIIDSYLAQSDIAFSAMRNATVQTEGATTIIYRDAEPEKIGTVLLANEQCRYYLSQRFAAENALTSIDIMVRPYSGSSYARKDYLLLSMPEIGQAQDAHHYLCHELAHFWTPYDDVLSADYWLVESMAEFIAAQAVQEQFGDEAFNRLISVWENRAMNAGPIWHAGLTRRAAHSINYGKGPLALLRLSQYISEDNFERFLFAYMMNHITRTEHLLEVLAEIAGDESSLWFADLLAQVD